MNELLLIANLDRLCLESVIKDFPDRKVAPITMLNSVSTRIVATKIQP
jgi:hypothetical protein